MKNSADLGGCYPPRPSASVDNTLLDLQNSSLPTQPHSIIANDQCCVDNHWSVSLACRNHQTVCLKLVTLFIDVSHLHRLNFRRSL